MRLAERIAALSSYASSFGRTMSFALIVYIVVVGNNGCHNGYCRREL